MIDPKIEILRRFIAAGLCDLIGYLDNLDTPIVVGGDYPRDRLLQAFRAWCVDRKMSVADADADGWLAACKGGSLTPPTPLPTEPKPEPEPEPEPGPAGEPEPEPEPEPYRLWPKSWEGWHADDPIHDTPEPEGETGPKGEPGPVGEPEPESTIGDVDITLKPEEPGFFDEDAWKSEGEKDKPWFEKGEDWKEGENNAST
jgi:hypothetical protein